ncbi:MAG: nucleotide pyrophosphohydrolase [Promethearchaeia archaeon]
MKNNPDSLHQIQENVDKWISRHGGYWPPLSMLGSIMEEVGELSREINHAEGHKPKKVDEPLKIGEELADLLFSIICIANYYDINLEKKIKEIISKYTNRDAKRFK